MTVNRVFLKFSFLCFKDSRRLCPRYGCVFSRIVVSFFAVPGLFVGYLTAETRSDRPTRHPHAPECAAAETAVRCSRYGGNVEPGVVMDVRSSDHIERATGAIGPRRDARGRRPMENGQDGGVGRSDRDIDEPIVIEVRSNHALRPRADGPRDGRMKSARADHGTLADRRIRSHK